MLTRRSRRSGTDQFMLDWLIGGSSAGSRVSVILFHGQFRFTTNIPSFDCSTIRPIRANDYLASPCLTKIYPPRVFEGFSSIYLSWIRYSTLVSNSTRICPTCGYWNDINAAYLIVNLDTSISTLMYLYKLALCSIYLNLGGGVPQLTTVWVHMRQHTLHTLLPCPKPGISKWLGLVSAETPRWWVPIPMMKNRVRMYLLVWFEPRYRTVKWKSKRPCCLNFGRKKMTAGRLEYSGGENSVLSFPLPIEPQAWFWVSYISTLSTMSEGSVNYSLFLQVIYLTQTYYQICSQPNLYLPRCQWPISQSDTVPG